MSGLEPVPSSNHLVSKVISSCHVMQKALSALNASSGPVVWWAVNASQTFGTSCPCMGSSRTPRNYLPLGTAPHWHQFHKNPYGVHVVCRDQKLLNEFGSLVCRDERVAY
eukprot:334537-Pelagomonas_calceolata.AAC.5